MNTYISTSILISAAACIIACTRLAYADTVRIENSVHVSSNTGGNVSRGGSIVTGTTSNRLDIHTVVNGHVVEDVHEATSSPIHYEYHFATSTSHAVLEKTNIHAFTHTSSTQGHPSVAAPTARLVSDDDFPNEERNQTIISVFRILMANFSLYVRNWFAF